MEISFDTTGLRRLQTSLDAVPAAIERAAYRSINAVAKKTLTAARRRIVSQVMLTPSYVKQHMGVKLAGPGRLPALVYAWGSPPLWGGPLDGTPLARFRALQRAVSARRAKGDPSRGIRSGMKQGGVSVNVKRGASPTLLKRAFPMPLRAGPHRRQRPGPLHPRRRVPPPPLRPQRRTNLQPHPLGNGAGCRCATGGGLPEATGLRTPFDLPPATPLTPIY